MNNNTNVVTNEIDVELISFPSIDNIIRAARICHSSEDRDSAYTDDINLLKRLWKLGHHSVFEHGMFIYEINGCSQVCMSQITRHRTFKFSIRSKRYTLKKNFNKQYYVHTDNNDLNNFIDKQIEILNEAIDSGKFSNDELEYIVPMGYKTKIFLSADFRNLYNFFKLRLSSSAHFEIRYVSQLMFDKIPDIYKDILRDYL